MKKVYVIYKEGVYGHGVHGVFASRIDAKRQANQIAQKDNDNYHSWKVFKIPMNTIPPASYIVGEGFTSAKGRNMVYAVKRGE